MSSRAKLEKWILSGQSEETSNNKNEILQSGRKNDEQTEAEGKSKIINSNESSSETRKLPDEDKDFSESASSWEPSGGSCSSEDSDTEVQTNSKTIERHILQYIKRKKGQKTSLPMRRPNAVVKLLQECKNIENNRKLNDIRKRKFQETLTINKSLPDSTKKNILPPKDVDEETISVSKKNMRSMKTNVEELLQFFYDMKLKSLKQNFTEKTIINNKEPENSNKKDIIETHGDVVNISDHEERSDKSQSVESNRSDDNVLITNKYHSAHVLPNNENNKKSEEDDEWVPIGSGKTLIHKDKYRKVNWKSYTIATRTLLLATFQRRVLATHSLTGKRSPAFLHKPPKMCLDPKIVSDIIIEITSKFKVKENLVRGIITTKCADECKMLKMRLKNKNAPLKGFNVPNQAKESEQTEEKQ